MGAKFGQGALGDVEATNAILVAASFVAFGNIRGHLTAARLIWSRNPKSDSVADTR
ncbi:MAG TPA: hypothetical protein VHD61_01500 [Lacunisphaera sp.]|nr:hypothetical protein [Lacunisphaera sp.]